MSAPSIVWVIKSNILRYIHACHCLNGYLLHQRPYQEKRAIYQFFSYEKGVVHGIGGRGMPLFTPIWLMSSGTKSLKALVKSAWDFQMNLCGN